MYQIGDLIIYGSQGVCKVDKIGIPDIPGIDKDRVYYTLCPIYQGNKIFTPVDTSVFMRPVITYTEAQKLICLIPSINENMKNCQNKKALEDHYHESMQTHECSDLVQVIKTIYSKKVIAVGQGKKLGQTDERFMKKAEDLLYSELSVALNIPKENVKKYIENKVNSTASISS